MNNVVHFTKKDSVIEKESFKPALPDYKLDGIASKPVFFKDGQQVDPPKEYKEPKGIRYF